MTQLVLSVVYAMVIAVIHAVVVALILAMVLAMALAALQVPQDNLVDAMVLPEFQWTLVIIVVVLSPAKPVIIYIYNNSNL